jgi:hypothetical protein
MRNLILIFLAISVLTCEKEPPLTQNVSVTLTVKGSFDGLPLQMYNRDYLYVDGVKIKFQLFNFYLSDLYLINETATDKKKVLLSEVALISFKEIQSAQDAEKGFRIVFKNIPVGTYSGLIAGVGVAPRLNATGPASYPPPHPLDDNYWSWAAGYVFSKIEGNADIDNSGKFATKLTFHAGGDPYYKVVSWTKPISISKESSEITLTLDVKDLIWRDQNNFIDFKKITTDHSVNKELVSFLLTNLQQGLKIR